MGFADIENAAVDEVLEPCEMRDAGLVLCVEGIADGVEQGIDRQQVVRGAFLIDPLAQGIHQWLVSNAPAQIVGAPHIGCLG